jgi:putative colanic acid biosynthesis acetyltransferase WcaF
MATTQHEQAPPERPLQAQAPASAPPRAVFQRLDRTASFPYTFREYFRRFLWEWTERTMIRLSPRRAHGWRRFWLRAFGAKMTPTSCTKASTRVRHPWLFTMAEFSAIAEDVTIYNLGPVSIGAHTVISQDAYVCAGSHDYTKAHLPLTRPSITIGSGVWVCAGAFIGPGVKVGDNAVVGARAVVTSDVPAGMIAAGNPARSIKQRRMDWDAALPGETGV